MPGAEPGGRLLRADARRNREMIIAAAEELFLRDGANASLEEIARRAGVGSATLHRHFPTRKNLLETVHYDHVRELCDAAESLAADHDPAQALIAWLRLVDTRTAVNNGLSAAIAADEDGGTPGSLQSCRAMIAAAGSALLSRAVSSGGVRSDVEIRDLLELVNALARADRGHAHTADDQNRLLMLALTGIMARPAGCRPGPAPESISVTASDTGLIATHVHAPEPGRVHVPTAVGPRVTLSAVAGSIPRRDVQKAPPRTGGSPMPD